VSPDFAGLSCAGRSRPAQDLPSGLSRTAFQPNAALETHRSAPYAAKNRKMSELQDAMTAYGKTSVRVRDIIHAVGNSVADGLPDYLGERKLRFRRPAGGGIGDLTLITGAENSALTTTAC